MSVDQAGANEGRPVLIVTGGSRGIGAATVCLAAESGYDVAFTYHSQKEKADAVLEKCAALGARAFTCQADVADVQAMEAFFQEVDGVFGRLDALVNNAATIMPRTDFLKIDAETFSALVQTNLCGTFNCMKLAVQRMSKDLGGEGGAIVNISSEAARFGGNRISGYAASKAGVNALSIGTARELAEVGVRVNVVSPGVIETDPLVSLSPEERAQVERSLPMGRMGSPREAAETILWALSSKASYVSGSIITVSGAR